MTICHSSSVQTSPILLSSHSYISHNILVWIVFVVSISSSLACWQLQGQLASSSSSFYGGKMAWDSHDYLYWIFLHIFFVFMIISIRRWITFINNGGPNILVMVDQCCLRSEHWMLSNSSSSRQIQKNDYWMASMSRETWQIAIAAFGFLK